ncbi:hypothetical protein C471_15152 [Halorubrum saccharovorum DSM 1137]|uniref:Flagellin n=1 Tax=Halorubrum saccharovorum DSM 1137 TaxID=1227484 RepID=M0DMW4_9EURY|nr:hypothetical protein [Halorubrum saccharovorum]ELZ36158.1 hypothetical protein C471_15152 [Halorubrum saccharovorum DSM 1137]
MSDRRRPTVSIGDGGLAALADDERGVSNVVGYVLVFSLVTVTIGTVFAVGITGLEDRQEAARVANVERAFDVFDDNLRDVQRYGDPSRSTEIRLSGGTLSVAETTGVELRNASDGVVRGFEFRALTYANGDTTIAYEGGAWFRSDGGSAVMRSEPRFVAADGRTTLPIVRLYPLGPETVDRDGTVQVAVSRTSKPNLVQVATAGADDGPFDLRIESPYAEAWSRYFERTDGFSVNGTATDTANGTVVADLDHGDEVFIADAAVNIRLQR